MIENRPASMKTGSSTQRSGYRAPSPLSMKGMDRKVAKAMPWVAGGRRGVRYSTQRTIAHEYRVADKGEPHGHREQAGCLAAEKTPFIRTEYRPARDGATVIGGQCGYQ